MQHEIFGEIKTSDCDPYDAEASVSLDSREIGIGISKDDQTLETAIRLAAEVAGQLTELDKLARQVAVVELLDAYNNTWNEYDEQQEDGSYETISNLPLSETEFLAKISLEGISISGDRSIDFYYDHGDMFLGHWIVVCSRNGIDLSEAYAELFG